MKLRTLFSLLLVVFFYSLQAQTEQALTEIKLEGPGMSIFFHSQTGIPIIQTRDVYTAVHPETHEVLWSVPRSVGAAVGQMLDSGDDLNQLDYTDFHDTPFAYLGGTIINVQTGQKLVDGQKDEIKRFMTYYIIPEQDLMLIQLNAKGKIRLYGINPFTSERKWDVDLRETGLNLGAIESDNSIPFVIPPLLTDAGDLLYHNDKYLASINLKNGSLNWNEKLNPGYIFINEDATKLLVAEKRGAIGGAMNMAMTDGNPNKFSKKMYLIDATTGKSLWSKGDTKMEGNIKFIMPYETGFFVVHDEGFNRYEYKEGKEAEGLWKKDIAIKGINDIVVEDKGLMVYFKNRRTLIDPNTGEELWKKAEKLERERPDYVMARKANSTVVGDSYFYTRGGNMFVSINNKKESSYRSEAHVFDKDRNVLVITRIEDPNTNYVGPLQYEALAINLSTGDVAKKQYPIRKVVEGVDIIKNGFFFYNDRGYASVAFNNGSWGEAERKYYPDPSRGERFLKGAALIGAQIGYSAHATSNAMVSNKPNSMDAYNNKMDAVNGASEATSGLYTRKRIGKVGEDYAYFFSKNDDKDLVLFKVDKNTGKEVKQYPFEDKTPIYEVDDWNNKLYYLLDDQLKVFKL